ncbi:hypothetical protein BCY91_11705 [Pelobium manganitolerans]|uniref:Type IV secretion system putative lipoprotein virB7 n=1 Tax=Pelobium manganitolerans TaxID=1842495 RepID=A0A419S2G2_9SPHI|nr:membrane lipoprotein lipid attachment site-containing protein [Pelobium manganitolerans]RKD12897.1 hypothetical protein BCY91_11705 [Pelobium manganitolerans]
MKKIFLFLTAIAVLSACTNDSKQRDNEVEQAEVPNTSAQPATLFDVPWSAVLDSASQKIQMTQTKEVKTEDLNLANVTESINRKYPEITITQPRQSHDTVYVSIPNAQYLTQGAGTMGAEIYLAESTYSFTQIPGVTYVNFDFKTGDHASPGTFDRTSFEFKK